MNWKENIALSKLKNLSSVECYKTYRVCSIHFEDNVFAGMSKSRLKRDAVPTLHLPEPDTYEPYYESDVSMDITLDSTAEENLELTGVEEGSVIEDTSSVFEKMTSPEPGPSRSVSGLSGQIGSRSDIDANTQTPKRLARTQRTKLLNKVQTLRRKLKSVKPQPRHTQLQDVIQYLKENCSPAMANFIEKQLMLSKTGKVAHYSDDYKQFALTLYFHSPKAYKFLARTLKLPSKSTLYRITQKWNIGAGCNNFIFEVIRKKVEGYADEAKNCILCLDEMAVKANLFYNTSRDEIVGFHDTFKRTNQPARNALVLMIRGITNNWKQPLAFFCSILYSSR